MRGIDHLVLCVRDLDTARKRYQELGFTLTPKAIHPFGTANSLVQFSDRSFLEPLAIENRKLIQPAEPGFFSFAEYNRHFIESGPGEGFSMLVLDSTDSKADHATYTGAGLIPYEHFGFKRQATLPSGEEVEVRFSMAFVTHPDMPDTAYFTCQQHHAPVLFWKQEFQTHENTAEGVAEVVLLTEDPHRQAGFFQKFVGTDKVVTSDENITLATSRGKLSLMNLSHWARHFPQNFAPDMSNGPRLAAYKLFVGDLDATAKCLRAASITFMRNGNEIVVAPGEAFGVMIAFCER
jgi:hypothetical protein